MGLTKERAICYLNCVFYQISRMLQQISSGKIFDSDDIFLAPLNDYVFHAGKRFAEWFMQGNSTQKIGATH